MRQPHLIACFARYICGRLYLLQSRLQQTIITRDKQPYILLTRILTFCVSERWEWRQDQGKGERKGTNNENRVEMNRSSCHRTTLQMQSDQHQVEWISVGFMLRTALAWRGRDKGEQGLRWICHSLFPFTFQNQK